MSEDPIVVALELDAEAQDVSNGAAELARRMGRPLVIAHAVGRALPGEPGSRIEHQIARARERIEALCFGLDELGVEIEPPIVASGAPAELTLATARDAHAHMIVTGGGSPPTVRRWLFGSTAEKIVRASPLPVFVCRGTLPGPTRAVSCPVGDSPEARLGLAAAVRMARLFEAKLHILRVVDPKARGWLDGGALEGELEREIGPEREALERFLATCDLAAVPFDARVVVGDPAQRIVEASEEAALLVLGSPGFDRLIAASSLPTVAEHAFRAARTSVLCIPDRHVDAVVEDTFRKVAELKREADELLERGDAARALPLLQEAAARAPADAAVQVALAKALHAVGRMDEAGARLGLAREIRGRFR